MTATRLIFDVDLTDMDGRTGRVAGQWVGADLKLMIHVWRLGKLVECHVFPTHSARPPRDRGLAYVAQHLGMSEAPRKRRMVAA